MHLPLEKDGNCNCKVSSYSVFMCHIVYRTHLASLYLSMHVLISELHTVLLLICLRVLHICIVTATFCTCAHVHAIYMIVHVHTHSCLLKLHALHPSSNTQNAAVAPRPSTTHPLVWAEQHKHTSVYNLPVPGLHSSSILLQYSIGVQGWVVPAVGVM